MSHGAELPGWVEEELQRDALTEVATSQLYRAAQEYGLDSMEFEWLLRVFRGQAPVRKLSVDVAADRMKRLGVQRRCDNCVECCE